jgi:hypothetical protein
VSAVPDQVDEACFAEDVERFAVRQQVEIAAQDGEVAGLADVGDQRGEAFGLGSSGRGVVLALGVTQPVNLDDGDRSCPALECEPRRQRVARPAGQRPSLVPRELVVHEPGDDIGHRDRVVDEGADAELLLVGHPGRVPHRACVARGEEDLVSRQQRRTSVSRSARCG